MLTLLLLKAVTFTTTITITNTTTTTTAVVVVSSIQHCITICKFIKLNLEEARIEGVR